MFVIVTVLLCYAWEDHQTVDPVYYGVDTVPCTSCKWGLLDGVGLMERLEGEQRRSEKTTGCALLRVSEREKVVRVGSGGDPTAPGKDE